MKRLHAVATPEREGSIVLADGRLLGWSEWAVAIDRPVLLLPGTPGSSHFCPDVEATRQAGVRLISVDRAGYGWSDRQPGRSVLASAADLVELLDHLGIVAAGVVGWSGGASFALALAAHAPDRITRLALVAGSAPPEERRGGLAALPDEDRDLIARVRSRPDKERKVLLEELRPYADDPGAIMPDADAEARAEREAPDTDPDRAVRMSPGIGDALTEMFRHGALHGAEGWVDDTIALLLPQGFSLSEIRVPTTVWYGAADELAQREDSEVLADRIQGARLVVKADSGHLLPVLHWAEVLRESLT